MADYTNIQQLMMDWPRRVDRIYINGTPLKEMFKRLGIPESNLDINDPATQTKFKILLSSFIGIPKGDLEKQREVTYEEVAGILKQGALIDNLETKVDQSLSAQGFSRDNTRKTIRRADLTLNEKGFSLKSEFTYEGNISKQNPEDPLFDQANYKKPMIKGAVEYQVSLNKEGLNVKPKASSLSVADNKLKNMIDISTLKTTASSMIKNFKNKLSALKNKIKENIKENISENKSKNDKPTPRM